MTENTYAVRPHLFSGIKTYRLETDALVVLDGATEQRIPFADIASVQLITYASYGGPQWQCTIKAGAHGALKIRSHHFISTGEFEDRSGTYSPFVRELCRRIHAANAGAKFIWGSRGLQIAWLVVLACAAVCWLIWMAVLLESAANPLSVVTAFTILVLASLLGVRSVRVNKVEYFEPLRPPLP